MKTVRFTQVVERSGQPRVHTLWVAPEKDPEFKRALQANRVLTVERGERGGADVGRVGYASGAAHGGQFLLFPKSLQPFAGRRVVGIKFDLVAQPKTVLAPPTAAMAPLPAARQNGKRPAPAPIGGVEETVKTASTPAHEEIHRRRDAAADEVDSPKARRTRRSPPPPRTRVPPTKPAAAAKSDGEKPALKTPVAPAADPPKPVAATSAADSALTRQVRAALKELKAGKTVAAYQRLERAVAAGA